MNFLSRRRGKTAPTVIIISLIDILIVLLIFLMVTTTFKQHPAVRVSLPQSRQATTGASAPEVVLLTIAQQQPHFYLDTKPVTFDKLQQELMERARINPATQVAVRADSNAPVGQLLRVMDAIKDARLKEASILTRPAGK